MDTKSLFEIASAATSILAIAGTAGWFLYTEKIKPRLQFDLECRFLPMPQNGNAVLLEIQFIFTNKGFVEHRLWNLNLSVHGIVAGQPVKSIEGTRKVAFPLRILPKVQLVPPQYGYYFVRPGVCQVITHILEIPPDVAVLRITASFDYNKALTDPHTAQRVFLTPSIGAGESQQVE